MHLTKEQLSTLMSPLWADRVKTLRAGGRSTSYLEAYDVKATLIRVFGFGGFSADVIDTKILQIERDVPKSGEAGKRGETNAFRVTAMSTVRLTIHPQHDEYGLSTSEPVTYTEAAVAAQTGPDPGEVADFAVKTAESDALKRCATYLGTQFGLSLYNNGSLQELVQAVYEPHQAALLAEIRAEQAAAAEAARPRVQGIIDGATTTTAEENAS